MCSILGAAAFFGFTPFGKTIIQQVAGSSVGSTFNTAKFAGIDWTLTNGATSTSVLNSDASDRYVTSFEVGCQSVGTSLTAVTGAGLISLQISAATTSTSAPAVVSNTNLVGGGVMVIATSTPQFVEASSTASTAVPNTGRSTIANVWSAGSYMTFWSNATNTAACVVGVRYLAS